MAVTPAQKPAAAAKPVKDPGPFAVLTPVDVDSLGLSADAKTDLGDAKMYVVVGEFVGKTSKQAIGMAVAQNGGGEYIAVPKRSFTPRKVESVGVPRLKWS